MSKNMEKRQLILPITILLASIVLGSFILVTQIIKQRSIERQQQLELQAETEIAQVEAEQQRKEYVAERTKDCYNYEDSEREKFNNVKDSWYREDTDVCVIQYTTHDYDGVDCATEYKGNLTGFINCNFGVFTKEF
jgi:hypothetical protein